MRSSRMTRREFRSHSSTRYVGGAVPSAVSALRAGLVTPVVPIAGDFLSAIASKLAPTSESLHLGPTGFRRNLEHDLFTTRLGFQGL